MDLAAIEASFRVDADDAVEPYLWSSPDVRRWANEAEEEACLRARLIADKTSGFTRINVAAGKSILTLNDAIFEVRHARLLDAAGTFHPLTATNSDELDWSRPMWRTEIRRPTAYIHYDKTLELDAPADAAYTLHLEVYRLPVEEMANDSDTPEIGRTHHRNLVHWILHRAYSKPDTETLNLDKAAKAAAEFERYFGPRPNADQRRKQQANRPHRNKAYW